MLTQYALWFRWLNGESISPSDMTCILSCRIPGPETATKINRLSIYMYNPRVDMRPKPQSFGIRKGILHTWLLSHLAGLWAWVLIDAASKHIELGREWPDLEYWMGLYFMSILLVEAISILHVRKLVWSFGARMKIAWACYNLSMGSLEASWLKKCVKWFQWASGQNRKKEKN